MTLKLFRCRICGDPYLGSEAPSFCPFCGRAAKIPGARRGLRGPQRCPQSQRPSPGPTWKRPWTWRCDNAAFYMCASNCAPDPLAKAMFKALWRTEAEHASLICKTPQGAQAGDQAG